MTKPKLIRITTVPISLDKLLEGQLNFMNKDYDVIAVSSDGEYLKKIGKKENVATFHLEMTRKITPLKDFSAIIKLYFYLLKSKPLIVHTHTPKAGLVGMLASKMANIPNRLHTVAGLPLMESNGFKRKILILVEKLTYRCATKVYPNSNGLLEFIIKNKFCNPKKLKVIGDGSSNGIDTEYFDKNHFSEQYNLDLKQKLNINSNDFVFIFVGRIVSDKGINELISAFSKINSENKNTKLLLVGPFEDDLDPISIEAKNEIKNNKSIISVGYQNDVRPYFAISSCLVFPSYREGFPNVVLQAGAMDLPSIVTNINGCNEIIQNQENGLIIAVKDEKAIFDAMKLLILDTDVYQKLKQNSRKKIVNNYEQKLVLNAVLEEYKKLENNV